MKFYGDINLNDNELQASIVQKETAFPSTAKVGRLSFIDQVLYMCVDLNGTDPIWYPLTNKITTYEHTQSTANTTWNIVHNLNTTAPIVQVMDNGNIVIPDGIAIVDKNNITITFNTAVSGTAVVMYGNVLSPLGTGVMNAPLSGKNNFITLGLNPSISEGILSEKNLQLQNVNGNWDSGVSDKGYTSGKYYFEVQSIVAPGPEHFGIGITLDKNNVTSQYIGYYSNQLAAWFRWNIPSQPRIISNQSVKASGTIGQINNSVGIVMGLGYDFDTGKIDLYYQNTTTPIVSYTDASKAGQLGFPVISTKPGQTIKVNFGDSTFSMSKPSGYVAWVDG